MASISHSKNQRRCLHLFANSNCHLPLFARNTLTQAEVTVTETHPTDSVDVDGHVEVPVLLEAGGGGGGGGRAQPGAGVVRLLGPDPALQTRPRRVV